MITTALVDEGSIEKYNVTQADEQSKYYTACKTIDRYDDKSELLIHLWNGKTLLVNPVRVIWTLHEAE